MLPDLGNLTEPLFFKGAFKDKLKFGWKECEDAINRSAFLKNIEVINFDGKKQTLNAIRTYWFGECYDIRQIAAYLDEGNSFALNKMSCVNESFNAFCNDIEERYNAFSDIHVYGGLYAESRSFGPHADKPHNLIVQLDGISKWIVFAEKLTGAGFADASARLTPVIDIIMEPGDGIFVPSLQTHVCIPQTKRLSASIPFYPSNIRMFERGWVKLGD